MPSAAEFCLRQLVLLGMQNKECYENVLLQTTLLGIKAFEVGGDRKWLDENKAILSQVKIFDFLKLKARFKLANYKAGLEIGLGI